MNTDGLNSHSGVPTHGRSRSDNWSHESDPWKIIDHLETENARLQRQLNDANKQLDRLLGSQYNPFD